MKTAIAASVAAVIVSALCAGSGQAQPEVAVPSGAPPPGALFEAASVEPGAASPPFDGVTTSSPRPSARASAASPGLVASWPFDDRAGEVATDASGNGLDGVLHGMDPTWSWVDGQHAGALRFDSFDDRVEVGADERLALTEALTVELWVRFGSYTTNENVLNGGLYRFYHRGDWAGDRLYFLYRVTEPELSGDSSWPHWTGVRTQTELVPGRWYHVAAVVSGSSAAIYLDGVLERQLDVFDGRTKDLSAFEELVLGAAPFGGSLDEVSVHSRALAADEIAAHAARGFWRFDEGGGAVAHDASPYANDCSLHNVDWDPGRGDGALLFDGIDDYADCGKDASLDLEDDITLETWVRFVGFADRQLVLSNGRITLARHGGGADGGLFFLHRIDGDGPGGDSPWGGWSGVRSAVPITLGAWHHVLGVKHGDDMSLYVDGVRSGPIDALSGFTTDGAPIAPLRLGADPFVGLIGHLSLSDRALTDEQAERRFEAPGIGAQTNPTGDAIGGGRGYQNLVSPSAGVYTVSDLPNLLHALSQGADGDIVYVADDAVIDLTGKVALGLRRGVTLASGRGRVGPDGTVSPGALLLTDQHDTSPLFETLGEGVRVTGLRIRGPDLEIGDRDFGARALSRGITLGHSSAEVDNCELLGWGYGALVVQDGAEDVRVHHNHIHHNRRTGYGYGVRVTGAAAVLEANTFDFNRQHVMGGGTAGTALEVNHNVVGEHVGYYNVSMYGARDNEWSISKGNWRFDEGQGDEAADTSSYADNDCAVHGPAWVEGRIKTALRFDGGDDYVTCGAGERLDLTDRVSLEAWVRPRSLPERAIGAGIVGKNGGGGDWADVPYQLAQSTDGALTFSVGDGTRHDWLTIPIPALDTWYHVVGVYDRGTMAAYRNGEIVDVVTTFIAPRVDTSRALLIGRWHETFDGVIDEVRLHSGALSADAVRIHYLSPDIAGDRVGVHHNTFLGALIPSLVVRGRPAEPSAVHHNWFPWPDRAGAVRQYYADENLDVLNNRYGSAPPSDAVLPSAEARAHPRSGEAPLTVSFDAAGSTDPSGQIRTHRWRFGDGAGPFGATADGPSPAHTFAAPGRYPVELTVTGDSGAPDTETVDILVSPPAGRQALSLWVKDSYRGALTARYRKQVLVGPDVVWEDDVEGDEGWLHVVADVTERLAGQREITVTLRVLCETDVTDPATDVTGLAVYWDDVALFHGALENGDFESATGWSYAEKPQGARWSGAVQSGDVRSGGRAYMVTYPYNAASEARSYAQIQQVVALTPIHLPYASAAR